MHTRPVLPTYIAGIKFASYFEHDVVTLDLNGIQMATTKGNFDKEGNKGIKLMQVWYK